MNLTSLIPNSVSISLKHTIRFMKQVLTVSKILLLKKQSQILLRQRLCQRTPKKKKKSESSISNLQKLKFRLLRLITSTLVLLTNSRNSALKLLNSISIRKTSLTKKLKNLQNSAILQEKIRTLQKLQDLKRKLKSIPKSVRKFVNFQRQKWISTHSLTVQQSRMLMLKSA